jgi:hypothetical protein
VSPTEICTDEGPKAKPEIFTSTVFGAVFCEVSTGVVDVFVDSMGDAVTVAVGEGACVGVLLVLVHPIVKKIPSKTTKTIDSFLMAMYCYFCHI